MIRQINNSIQEVTRPISELLKEKHLNMHVHVHTLQFMERAHHKMTSNIKDAIGME